MISRVSTQIVLKVKVTFVILWTFVMDGDPDDLLSY